MSKYFEADKGVWASTFQNEFAGFRPRTMTKFQVKKALMLIWDDDNFWFQCAGRFGFEDKPISEISTHAKEHAASNFWAMLREALEKSK